jgi:hypothetical protein
MVWPGRKQSGKRTSGEKPASNRPLETGDRLGIAGPSDENWELSIDQI